MSRFGDMRSQKKIEFFWNLNLKNTSYSHMFRHMMPSNLPHTFWRLLKSWFPKPACLTSVKIPTDTPRFFLVRVFCTRTYAWVCGSKEPAPRSALGTRRLSFGYKLPNEDRLRPFHALMPEFAEANAAILRMLSAWITALQPSSKYSWA